MTTPHRATEADLERLVVLEQVAFPDHPWSRADLLAELRRDGAIGLLLPDGPLLGAALGWAAGGACELTRISVAPAARQRGLGRMLLDAFVDRARETEADEVWLEVRADNAAAIHLYASAGFTPSGRRPGYYADGCDALLMALPINPTG